MIFLRKPQEPYPLHLPYGVTLTVNPLLTSTMLFAQYKARKRLEEQGLASEKPVDQDPRYHQVLIEELAITHITAWEGVSDETGEKEAELTHENIRALMNLYPLGEQFFSGLTLQQMLLNAAKKGLRPGSVGPSKRERTIAKDAPPLEPPSS